MFKHFMDRRGMLSGLTKKTCILVIGEGTKRVRHSQICTIENWRYI